MKKLDWVCLSHFAFTITLFFSLSANAQEAEPQEQSEMPDDTATVLSALDLIPEIIESPAESSVSAFLLQDRFLDLQKEIPLRYNEHSHRYVDFFVDKRPAFTRRMLETKDLYFPTFEKALADYKLPDELKYLPLIESGLDPRIISRAGAGGLWQFMRATGRELGLQQNHYLDERFHPEKSTEAACRYLRQLHNIFGDWEMALAAYNCGPGNIRRAIRRTGKSDFWGIYPALPKETRNYVPQFVAMMYLMHYAKDHGIAPSELKLTPVADTVQVDGYLNLSTFASLGGMSMDEIYELNPHLISTHIPQTSERFKLKIPATKAALICDELVGILDSSSKVPANGPTLLASTTKVVNGYEVVTTSIRHTVKGGQTLSGIAHQHGVTVAQIKAWNKLRNNTINKGQRLTIQKSVRKPVQPEPSVRVAATKSSDTVPAQAANEAVSADGPKADDVSVEENTIVVAESGQPDAGEAAGEHMTEAALLARQEARLEARLGGENAKRASNTPTRAVEAGAAASKSAPLAAGQSITHTIARGETLISIAKKYNVQVDDIKKQNGLSGNGLVAGKKLQIATAAQEAAVATESKRKSEPKSYYHVVQAGDTLWAISKRYGMSVDKIKKVNKIKGDALKAGMKILISG